MSEIFHAPSTIRTNLTSAIETLRELRSLAEHTDGAPHAKHVHRWHSEYSELLELVADIGRRDAETCAETLPVEGSAHELTASLPESASAAAEHTREVTDTWCRLNEPRLRRLYAGAAEAAWDHSTAPES